MCIRDRHQVVGVLTQPDRPAGRGQKLAQGPVKTFALAAGPVSYTHLTLPTSDPVEISGVAVSFKKKNTKKIQKKRALLVK